ncbi:50S ribosomal protein L2 [Candidatus Kaiserbacteria bacterium RIFCSPHIGHO2_02_FULL_59_21]|uniref:Large ribosomal subunit protein uL2 n=2 Tax=Candidatus Kaiseribacteriota TaxID=1752734 RepID=A0A0G2BN36_9BACT|nr:MAG: 50S ribosomal protein L2 [Candidatus Kaiserbacteria bacterium GW2011_GWA2_58_9]OGG63307.1 MAG: 50S ribosomal protein L2 [Candidatus Kaiserbacteria bacterium RIFCSPHIGHO2_01_FULL_58_22]OGG66626.1 MAG: 50S ribosomal protein L2 [Candidatus Kaiserbacteria bacterium RIFCSPHIGHO2_02_FULL_59_21]OGG78999.1 MAG: 50S ribosomal protein L2 [Candidatus Kaiserbacteria bacterium RIFCSPLOWO2_01_FULL_59_34]OGG84377.1 MAG: 50S ribosomal protein L2 [Candidatus Kaiserbacteria bacterium RIFCSPLOWO2_02_FULL_
MKTYKPVTKSTRQLATVEYRKLLSGHRPEKSLVRGKRNTGGRNAFGRITMRHRGGGHKKKYRLVDFRFDKKDVPARVASIEYDPLRSAFIGLAVYADGEKRYVVLPQRVRVGDTFLVSETAPVKPGNRLPLSKMPVGTFVYNIALRPGAKAALARSAGNYAEIVAQDAGYTHVKLPSTEVRKIIGTAWASVGEVSNEEYRLQVLGKAGRSRWMGIRPTVRGSAMNPVDHPHGGGEGRAGRGSRRQKTMWGKPAGKRQKTRRPKKYSNVFIVSRRRVGKRK